MEQNSFQVFPPPEFINNAIIFNEKYELFNFVTVGDERYSKRKLKGYSGRTCRFCGQSYPDVPFSTYAHLLPQLIGNPNLYSDFECDKCNAFFSGLENDLAAFLGISRSIVGLHGERKGPSFVARGMQAKSRSFIGENILIIAPEDVKIEGARTTISYTKNPYTPSNVYKALLKSALSLLDESVIKENYKHASDYLMGKIEMSQGAVIAGYRLSFNSNIPLHVFCFKKKHSEDKIPDHVISFNFQDQIIVLPLPSDVLRGTWNVIIPPPYFFDETIMQNAMPIQFKRDLSLNAQVFNEEEAINFQMNPKDLENTWSYDPLTDSHTQEPFNPVDLQCIILARKGVTMDVKKLSAFVKKHINKEG